MLRRLNIDHKSPLELTIFGLRLALEVLSWGGGLSLDVIPEVEESPVDSKKIGSLLILCCKKPLLDLWVCFYGLKIGFESTPKGFKDWF